MALCRPLTTGLLLLIFHAGPGTASHFGSDLPAFLAACLQGLMHQGVCSCVANGGIHHPSIHAESVPAGTRDGLTSPQVLFLGLQAAACHIASQTCLQSLAEALEEAELLREAMQAAAERIQSAQASQEGAEQAAAAAQAEAAELRKRVARLQGEVSVLSEEQVRSGVPPGVPAGVRQRDRSF